MSAKFPQEPQAPLSPSDLKVVLKELFEVRAKWRRIGVELDLTSGTLDAIEQRYSDSSDRLVRVLLEWLNKGSATWTQLVEALRSSPVGETKLARELEEKNCQKVEVIGAGVDRKRKQSTSEDSEQLHSDIRSMEKKFARFFTAIRQSFKERHVPITDLVSHLSGYRVFPAVMKSDGPKLLAHYQGDLSSANSIDEIFEIVSRFVSFLDFEILEDMITYFGAHNDRQSLADYIKSVQMFLDSWKVKPCKIIHHESGSQAKLYLKLDTESLSRYQNVKIAIAQILGVQIHALQLCSIDDGCVELVFLFPKVAVPSILPLKPLSDKFSKVEPQILRVTLSLVDEIVLHVQEELAVKKEMEMRFSKLEKLLLLQEELKLKAPLDRKASKDEETLIQPRKAEIERMLHQQEKEYHSKVHGLEELYHKRKVRELRKMHFETQLQEYAELEELHQQKKDYEFKLEEIFELPEEKRLYVKKLEELESALVKQLQTDTAIERLEEQRKEFVARVKELEQVLAHKQVEQKFKAIEERKKRISELKAKLESRSEAKSYLKQQAHAQEATIMELEAALSRVKEDLAQRQMEDDGTLKQQI